MSNRIVQNLQNKMFQRANRLIRMVLACAMLSSNHHSINLAENCLVCVGLIKQTLSQIKVQL